MFKITIPNVTAARIEEALSRIIAGGSSSYWDSSDEEDGPADAAIVARALVGARQEQVELLTALRRFADLVEGDLLNVGSGTQMGFDGRLTAGMFKDAKALLSRFHSRP